MPKIHEIKTLTIFFERIIDSSKKFEVRFNDRDYQTGDIVILNEYDKENQTFSGRYIKAEITYVLNNYEGLKEGFVVFGIYVRDFVTN